MKAAAIISLIVAIVLGIAAIGNFVEDNSKHSRAIDAIVAAPIASGASETAVGEANEAEAAERNDGILGLIAIVFLIGSLVMFSQAKRQAMPREP